MQNDNLVSVVIQVYNSEKYMEECLDSILNQTYENIEVIAVDDGSADSSLDVLKKYSNKIKVFKDLDFAKSICYFFKSFSGCMLVLLKI